MKKVRNRRIIGVILCMALLFGVVGTPMAIHASEDNSTAQRVVYDSGIDVTLYRGERLSAPEKAGYVFAGWYKADGKAKDGYSPMSVTEADNASSAIAKFVDEKILGFGFQLTAGTTIYSEKTDWRLLTSVDSLSYQSVGFQVKVGEKTQTLTSNKVYRTIYGYEYKDAYNYQVSYTPKETFSEASEYFMAYKLTKIPNSVFGVDIKVTPIWTTLDGTTVAGIAKTFTINSVLCELGENLQASKGTDFEGFATNKITRTWTNGYYNGSAGNVMIINDGNNAYAKLLPESNGGAATITRACNTAILKAGTYKLSMDVKLGTKADGTLSFGIWDGKAWSPAWPKVAIDTSKANAEDFTTVTYEFTLAADKTGTYANLDIAYTCVTAGENNYVMIDNIQVINTATNSNADTNAYGDFEGIAASPSGLLTTGGWKADNTGNNVIFISNSAMENELVVEDNGNKCFKFYTSTGRNTTVNFAGNTAFAEAGIYKMSVRAKLGSGATKVDNIGFRFYAQNNMGVGDITFSGLEELRSDEWITLEAYFNVPATVATTYINMNFWAFTHNDEINSVDNYVLMDDIEVRAVTLKACTHEYDYEFVTEPTTTKEGEVKAICQFCDNETTLKVMMTPRLVRDGLNLTWNAIEYAKGYKVYDNDMVVADVGDALTYAISPEAGGHNYTVEAYTDVVGYHNVSLRTNAVDVTVSVSDNLQASKGTDFEGFSSPTSGLLATSGWKADSTGNNVIFVSASALENELVVEGNGNRCFKFYTSTGRNSTVNFAGNTSFAEAGMYKMSAKVKLGSGATKVDNIGFRFYVAGGTLGTGDISFSGLEKLNNDEWVTLEAYFTVPETVATNYINMNFWAFTHNDEINSADNYVLIDDIEVRTITLNGKEQPVYSGMIESVYDGGVMTGVLAPKDTLKTYNIGGTDLGIPYYDATREQMYLLFGDTFSGINSHTGDWRSQTVGISKDFDLSDGLTFDSFISDQTGNAIQIIDSKHDSNSDGGEVTCIPTGGIAINGTHYVFYMSVREWLSKDWNINFCGIAKSTDGQSFKILNNLYWSETAEIGQANTSSILGQSTDTIKDHVTSHFLQIFPYQVDDYVYLFGIPSGRNGGVKIGRVLVNNIESFEKYEYYCGVDTMNNPIWVAGTEGLKSLENEDSSYIVKSPVGELSVCYNNYLGKYVMSYFSENKIVMRTSNDLIHWGEAETITTSAEYVQLYGGFTHELYMEQNGKVMYFFVSQYANNSLGEAGYNVRIVKVILK